MGLWSTFFKNKETYTKSATRTFCITLCIIDRMFGTRRAMFWSILGIHVGGLVIMFMFHKVQMK